MIFFHGSYLLACSRFILPVIWSGTRSIFFLLFFYFAKKYKTNQIIYWLRVHSFFSYFIFNYLLRSLLPGTKLGPTKGWPGTSLGWCLGPWRFLPDRAVVGLWSSASFAVNGSNRSTTPPRFLSRLRFLFLWSTGSLEPNDAVGLF